MAGDTTITVIGNMTDDPELRYTSSGAAVAKFRVASTPRFKKGDEWVDGDPLFLACNCWRQMAENVAESLKRGDRVIVQGRLRQRSYETREGEKRTVYELEVDEVGPSLKWSTATVNKMQRSGGNSGTPGGGTPAGDSGFGEDPWANSAPPGQHEPPRDLRGAHASAQARGGGFDDEPPF